MKKSIYIFGMICLSIILLGTIFKAMHLPGASILITIGLCSIALIFSPLALRLLLKETNDKLLKFVYYAGFISFSIDFMGALFKILHWPGAGWLLVIGIPLPFILFLPAYITYHNKRKLKADMSFFAIIIFMIYLGVFSTLLALKGSNSVYKAYAHSANAVSETNAFLKNDLKNSKQQETLDLAFVLVTQIDKLKEQLIITADVENNNFKRTDGSFDYETIHGKDKVLSFENYKTAGLTALNNNFVKYYSTLNKTPKNNECKRLFEEIEEYRNPIINGYQPLVTKLPLISALNVLTDWQNKILLIEFYNKEMQKTL